MAMKQAAMTGAGAGVAAAVVGPSIAPDHTARARVARALGCVVAPALAGCGALVYGEH